MTSIQAATARSHLNQLIDQVNDDATPLTIVGPGRNAVLVGESDWQVILGALGRRNGGGAELRLVEEDLWGDRQFTEPHQ